jgi:hypothetical protein
MHVSMPKRKNPGYEDVLLVGIKQEISDWIDSGWITRTMLYRLNELISMVGQEKRLFEAIETEEIHVSDMACTRWRSLLAYGVERNVGKSSKGDEKKQVIETVHSKLASWLTDYDTKMKIPLWDILYNIRR